MNYYEHHLGDYLRDTAHLSMVEDGAYRRLLDAYYIKEKPLPSDRREIFRLVRAAGKSDRAAVETVLKEFFVESPEGWRHKRCDVEIARYLDKQDKARASANARWNATKPPSERNANALPTQCEGNALQTPDSNHQSPKSKKPASRASALPEPFDITEDRKVYAEKTLPNVDVPELAFAFCDCHKSKGTVAKDWDATWRTYCRNGLKFGYPKKPFVPKAQEKVVRYDARGRVIE